MNNYEIRKHITLSLWEYDKKKIEERVNRLRLQQKERQSDAFKELVRRRKEIWMTI